MSNEWSKLNSDSLAGKYTRTYPKPKKRYALYNGKQKLLSEETLGVTYAMLVAERNKLLGTGGYRKDLLIIKPI